MDDDWRLALKLFAVLIWAAAQYGLIVWSLRDLMARPRVRGDNKIIWAFVILTVPIIGALLYVGFGPVTPPASMPRGRKAPAAASDARSPTVPPESRS